MSASWDNTVRLWNAESGAAVSQAHTGAEDFHLISNLSTSQSSPLAAISCSDGFFRVYDLRTLGKGAAVHAVLAHEGVATTALLHNSHVISGSEDKSVKIWDLRSLKAPLTIIRCSAGVNRCASFSLSRLAYCPGLGSR